MKIKIVLDANILFASLIKSGITAKLIFSDKFQLFAPEFLFQEFHKYKPLIMKKTHRTSEEFEQYYSIVKNRIKIISKSQIAAYISHASEITPDPKDTVYLALAMMLKCGVWSNDKDLREKQSEIQILTTKEIIDIENEEF